MPAVIPRILLPLANYISLPDYMLNGALADTDPVMADQTAHHVVNSDRSTADSLSVDAHGNQFRSDSAASGAGPSQTPIIATHAPLDAPKHDAIDRNIASSSVGSPAAISNDSISNPQKSAGDATSALNQPLNGVSSLSVQRGHDGSTSTEDVLNAENVGSDTDTSRTGSLDQSKDENRHLRSNSVKKPISFKPVSVTKTFLAKTVGSTTTPPPPAKVGEKSPVAATLQPMVKPRLVAKSGSGLRDIPRVNSHDGTGAPDGRMVWNKNQRELEDAHVILTDCAS